jgi:CheY-like chemotaxis protein
MAKILLVEDDEANAEIIVRFLRPKKHAVAHVWDGPSAVRHCSSERPDLILMDMMLPALGDGQKATREIRGIPGMERTPIIALSARCMPEEAAEMRQSGCDDVVTKPVDFKHLQARIDALLT